MTDTEASAAAAASSSAGEQAPANATAAEDAAPPDGGTAAAAVSTGMAAVQPKARTRGVDIITGPKGNVEGISISPVAVIYSIEEQFVRSPRLITLPVEQRFALAGKVAAVPSEHARLVERLAASISTSITEVGALNALYFLELCRELVPNFKDAVPPERLTKAAELSPHGKIQAAILRGEKPAEWLRAEQQTEPTSLIVLSPEEDKGLMYDAGRAVGGATKFIGGAALGGVGLVTDTLGVTDNAEGALAGAAEDAVDLVGDGVNAVVDSIDDGISGTADDFHQKGVVGTVGDGVADAVDLVTDFVGDAVQGIAGGVRGALDFLAGGQSGSNRGPQAMEKHKLVITVAELFGEERSLGLRLENRVVTKFTKAEAEKLGWRLGDCILAVGAALVKTQDELLAAISKAKDELKAEGTPTKFLVERLGRPPPGPKRGTLVFVGGRAARIQGFEAGGMMTVQFQDDGTTMRVPGNQG